MLLTTVALHSLLQVLVATPPGAVDTAPRNHVAFEVGAAVFQTAPYGASGLSVGLHVTSVQPGSAGIDFGLSTYVNPLTHGTFSMLTDLDAVYLASGPEGRQPVVALRGGLTTLVLRGMGLGANAGAGVLVRVGGSASFRIDYTYRRLLGGPDLSGLTVGVGVEY